MEKVLQITAPTTPTNVILKDGANFDSVPVHVWALIEEDGKTRVAGLIASGNELFPVDRDPEFFEYRVAEEISTA